MAEVTLKNYYTSRKRGGNKREKNLISKLPTEHVDIKEPPSSSIVAKLAIESEQVKNSAEEQKTGKFAVDSKEIVKTKRVTKKKTAAKATKTNQAKIDKFLKNSAPANVEEGNKNVVDTVNSSPTTSSIAEINNRSPKRSLPPPEETTPKKKLLVQRKLKYGDEPLKTALPSTSETPLPSSKTTIQSPMKSPVFSPSKNLLLSPSKRSLMSPRKLTESERLDLMINQSRSKLILSPKLDKLKEALVKFSEITSKYTETHKNFQNASIACASPSKQINQTLLSPSKSFAHERFKYITNEATTTTLVMPSKYKLLFEMFHSMDTVASLINNRKERVTFAKVQEGVQKMMKRTFNKHNLGQIITVWPEAYHVDLEKNSKKAGLPLYELVVTPNLMQGKGKKKKSFIPMNFQCLIDRQNEFKYRLVSLVKEHHQNFLLKQNLHLPDEKIKRWHTKFALDSLPEIVSSSLPEPPESKISTAKDVLNKIKGSIMPKKIENALKSVVDESKPQIEVGDIKKASSTKHANSALKGICTDILERVRARESADLLETVTRGPDDVKRLAMMQRLPKMVTMIWQFFVAERRVCFPLDSLVEKIIHSFESLMTQDEVKEHFKLITEEFSGWMTFIEITKGKFVKIDKCRNINEMLDNFKY